MKHLKIAFGLVLAAGLMAVVASPAMAVPRWVHCVKVEKGKWLDPNCTEAGAGTWETKELVGTSEVTSSGTLTLSDKEATGGEVKVECTGEDTGWVANLTSPATAGEDGTSTITNVKCIRLVNGACEAIVGVKARNLPWGSRLVEHGSEVRDELISGPKKEVGNGEPGWTVTCKTILGNVEDTCERSGGTQNVVANRTNGKTLFDFDTIAAEEPLAECSQPGKKSGLVQGSILQELRGLTALWVLAPNLKT